MSRPGYRYQFEKWLEAKVWTSLLKRASLDLTKVNLAELTLDNLAQGIVAKLKVQVLHKTALLKQVRAGSICPLLRALGTLVNLRRRGAVESENALVLLNEGDSVGLLI